MISRIFQQNEFSDFYMYDSDFPDKRIMQHLLKLLCIRQGPCLWSKITGDCSSGGPDCRNPHLTKNGCPGKPVTNDFANDCVKDP